MVGKILEADAWYAGRRDLLIAAGWGEMEAKRKASASKNRESVKERKGVEGAFSEEGMRLGIEGPAGMEDRMKGQGRAGMEELLPDGCAVPGAELGDEGLRPEYYQRAVVWAAQMIMLPRESRGAPPNLLALTILRYGMTEGGMKDLVVGMLPKVYPSKAEGMDGRTYGTDSAVDVTGFERQIADAWAERLKRGGDAGAGAAGAGGAVGAAGVAEGVVEGGI